MSAPEYYRDVVNCEEKCPCVLNRNVDASLDARFIPRGSTSRCLPGHAPLMVILVNPGEPQLGVEDRLYREKYGQELADIAWSFTEAVCEREISPSFPKLGADNSPTHNILMRHLASDVFNFQINDVLDHVVITNLVKCSTLKPNTDDYGFRSLPKKIQNDIGNKCVNQHLLNEIIFWRPKRLITLGMASVILKKIIEDNHLPITIDLENYHPKSRPITKKRTVLRGGELQEEKIVIDTARIRKEKFVEFGNRYRDEMLQQ